MSSPEPIRRPLLTLGPGTLIFSPPPGTNGASLDISCQVTAITIGAEGDSEDPTPVLCGGAVAGARTYTWTLSFTAFQDILADGLVDWTWKHAGAEVPFTFVPDETSATAQVTGVAVVDPVNLGGDVGQRNTSEVEWGVPSKPKFTPGDGAALNDTTPAVP